jgi:hypothetical protein
MDYTTQTILRAQSLLDHLTANNLQPRDVAYLRLILSQARATRLLDVSALERVLIGAPACWTDPVR